MTDKINEESFPFRSSREEVERAEQQKKETIGPAYSLAFTDTEFLLREELRPVRLQLELLRPELVLRDHGIESAIVFFGSSKIPPPEVCETMLQQAEKALATQPEDPELKQAVKRAENILENSYYLKEATRLAYLVCSHPDCDFVPITGGGPSFMEAANKGAYLANERSIALNMILPNEQIPNQYVSPELTFQFHYFAIRKMHFLMRAKALAAFPGGFGTMDELFEVLTLMQTNKIKKIPLLLFNKKFWNRVINFEGLIDEGTIRPQDISLLKYVETAEEAWQAIANFYQLDLSRQPKIPEEIV